MYYDELIDQIFNPFSQFIDGYWDKMGYRVYTLRTKTVKIPFSLSEKVLDSTDKISIPQLYDGMFWPLFRKYSSTVLIWYRVKNMIKQYFNDISELEEKQSFICTINNYKKEIKLIEDDHKDVVAQSNLHEIYANDLLSFTDDLKFYLTNLEDLMCRLSKIGQEIKELAELFKDMDQYKFVLNLLVHKKCCQENTFIWKDHGKGNKKYLASLIKHLHTKGYYKKSPSNEDVQRISKNTFRWSIGIDTIKHAKPDDFDFKFIPPAQ